MTSPPPSHQGLRGVRTHSLSALSSMGTGVESLNGTIWDAQFPFNVPAFAAEPKGVQPDADASSFPEYRPEDTRWTRRLSEEAQPPQSRDLLSPLISQFADALAREMGDRLRDSLAVNTEPEALERFARSARDRLDDDADSSSSRRRSPPPEPKTPEKKDDDVRAAVASMASRLSTLEGRQRALQGKMAKLDSQWGGDASQMSLAVADLQHYVSTQRQRPADADIGSLRGQLIALAHSIDKLDKRTAAIERRLHGDDTTVVIGPSGYHHTTHHGGPAYPQQYRHHHQYNPGSRRASAPATSATPAKSPSSTTSEGAAAKS